MTIFIAVLLPVLTFAFVAYPLFRQKLRPVDSVEDEKLRELHSRRDTTYSMLKELEFDFQSGILSEDDHRDLEAKYKKKAISILKDIDDLAKGTGLDKEIERQVLELRVTEKQVCPQCGTRHQKGDRFCSDCDAKPSQGECVD